jgi:hypothetical protein
MIKPLPGRYARIVVTGGAPPFESGVRLAGHIVAVTAAEPEQGPISFVVRIVSHIPDDPPSGFRSKRIVVTTPDRTSLLDGDVKDAPVHVDLELIADDEVSLARGTGGLVRFADDIPYESVCPDCQGRKTCDDCGGSGKWPTMTCPYCGGNGICGHCGGKGFITESD